MRHLSTVSLAFVLTLGGGGALAADSGWFWRLQPVSALYSPDARGWYVQPAGNPGGRETLDGGTSYTPTLEIGASGAADGFSLDLSAGGGALVNGAFNGYLARADVAVRMPLAGGWRVGPRVGYVFVDPGDWRGDAPVKLTADGAMAYGAELTLGSRRLSARLAAEYVDSLQLEAEAADAAQWELSAPAVDLTGYQVSLGIEGRF